MSDSFAALTAQTSAELLGLRDALAGPLGLHQRLVCFAQELTGALAPLLAASLDVAAQAQQLKQDLQVLIPPISDQQRLRLARLGVVASAPLTGQRISALCDRVTTPLGPFLAS